MLLQYDGIRQHSRFKAHFNNWESVVELQFKDLNYFYVYTVLTNFDVVRAIGKYLITDDYQELTSTLNPS